MKLHQTPLGEVRVASITELFENFSGMIQEIAASTNYPPGIGLTGGSSPKAYFEWLVEHPDALPEAKRNIIFAVSDERWVPAESEASNYGTAQRLFFDPFGVDIDNQFPWDTTRDPADAADWFGKLWSLSFGEGHAFDLCMLGMGEDGHTASLFPGSPLLTDAVIEGGTALFASVDVPGKGTRLTITAKGLKQSKKIAVFVTGASKADALEKVFHGPDAPISEVPVRLMKLFPEKVVWLVDEAAASKLTLGQ